MHALGRFADPSDVRANEALSRVCAIWRACAPLGERMNIPLLLENSVEVLSQALAMPAAG
jgi:hypothetical protein